MKSFLNISDFSKEELLNIININPSSNVLNNKSIGLIFEKPSTRTRLSFSVAISQLGGNKIDLKFEELNISRQESFEDTFKALNCYLDGIIYRTADHNRLTESLYFFDKPIINALSDISHPCQILGDLVTLKEHFGDLSLNLLWLGDMNNVCFSLVEAVNLINEIKLTICSPIEISTKNNWKINPNIKIVNDLNEIYFDDLHCIMTDVFISMNDENSDEKIDILKPYCVDESLFEKMPQNSVFMHCLPAKVGYEVSEEVFRGPRSIVWRQAYNRMIAQKKLLHFIYQ